MTFATHVSPFDVMSADAINAIVGRWPSDWRDHYHDRLAVLLLNERYFCWTSAHREAAKDATRVAEAEGVILFRS